MSRFKFRAWDKAFKKMFQVIQVSYEGRETLAWRFPFEDERVGWSSAGWEVGKECDLMQSIGRKDKNGKDIYEGDIVQTTYNGQKSRYEVIYHNCSFWFISESGTRYRADQIYWGSLEVVDHIYSSGTKRSRKVEDDDIEKFRHHEEFPY